MPVEALALSGVGLDARHGFRGLGAEVGANPALPTLDVALTARVEALMSVEGDPFLEDDLAELMAAA